MSDKISADGRFSYRIWDGKPPDLIDSVRMFHYQCRSHDGIQCSIAVSIGPHVPNQKPPVWQISGTFDKPTLTPSINCNGDHCWHGHITAGTFNKIDNKTPEEKQ